MKRIKILIVFSIFILLVFFFPKSSGGGTIYREWTECDCFGFEKETVFMGGSRTTCYGIPYDCDTSYNTEISSEIVCESDYTLSLEYLISTSYSELDTYLIYEKDNKFYCKSTEKEAEKKECYSHASNIPGGWSHLYALICGANYWMVYSNDAGRTIYGPFEK